MDLALNYLQRLICHKTQPTNLYLQRWTPRVSQVLLPLFHWVSIWYVPLLVIQVLETQSVNFCSCTSWHLNQTPKLDLSISAFVQPGIWTKPQYSICQFLPLYIQAPEPNPKTRSVNFSLCTAWHLNQATILDLSISSLVHPSTWTKPCVSENTQVIFTVTLKTCTQSKLGSLTDSALSQDQVYDNINRSNSNGLFCWFEKVYQLQTCTYSMPPLMELPKPYLCVIHCKVKRVCLFHFYKRMGSSPKTLCSPFIFSIMKKMSFFYFYFNS